MNRTVRMLAVAVLILLAALLIIWYRNKRRSPQAFSPAPAETAQAARPVTKPPDRSATGIHAHNLLLRKGPDFRIYVRWLDGQLARTLRNVNPSLDQPDSFNLNIRSGVIRVNIGDIGHYINAALADAPLRNVTLLADGPNLKLTGTLRKAVPLPVQVIASVSAMPDDRVRVHINKIDVLKVPVKGLLQIFHVSAADLVKSTIAGLQVEGNDLVLNTQELLPPPHIRGHLTSVSVDSPDIQAVYGDAAKDVERVELWRNFFSLKGGTIDFGTLTMSPVNIVLIDISNNPWFDLDLVHYRDQFASGYTRMTADSALQMFIPDRRDVRPGMVQSDSIQWFKDRSIPPPPQILQSVKK